MSDINKAPNDFFDNWNKIQSMSYKNVIELLVKRSSEKKILALIQFEIDQFSGNVKKDLFAEKNLQQTMVLNFQLTLKKQSVLMKIIFLNQKMVK